MPPFKNNSCEDNFGISDDNKLSPRPAAQVPRPLPGGEGSHCGTAPTELLEPLTAATPVDFERMDAETAAKAVAGVSPSQLIALECLLAGQNMIDSAMAAGVDRSTLRRWLKSDFNFQAAVNRGRRDLQENFMHRLERLNVDAATCVGRAVHEGDVKTALEVLKRLGALAKTTVGSDDPAVLQSETESHARRHAHTAKLAAIRRAKALTGAKMGLAMTRSALRHQVEDDERDRRRQASRTVQ